MSLYKVKTQIRNPRIHERQKDKSRMKWKLESSKFEWEEKNKKHRNKYKWQIRKTQDRGIIDIRMK